MTEMEMFKALELRFENLQQNILVSAQIQQTTMQTIATLKDLFLSYHTDQLQKIHRNPLNKYGKKCFSQSDEDGITLEIVRRLGIKDGIYAEFGVGNGLENNTLILASLGWSGFWVGGEELAFNYSGASKFKYIRDWITLDNISDLATDGINKFTDRTIDVLSLDLDGNDIYFAERLLSHSFMPKLFIVEYNAKFIPPSRFQIKYNANHHWTGDDYFGAALTNFVDMFAKYKYRLVCCNAHTGANAFFIKNEFTHLFNDTPFDVREIYSPPRYHLYSSHGHRPSAKVVEDILND
jgi:hypothetical protein